MIEVESKFQQSWRIKPDMQFGWHCWEDECVVYNDATGDTHLFSTVVLFMLNELSKRPAPVHRLAASLFGGEEDKEEMDVMQRLYDLLLELHALELVEPLTE